MLPFEFKKMYNILTSFLGEAKDGFDGIHTQLQFGCPHCTERYGTKELDKFNLECNFFVFQCWKCSSEGEDFMHGSVFKLIKLYGNSKLYHEYKECIESLKNSKLYDINFSKDFNVNIDQIDAIKLPDSFKPFKEDKFYPPKALDYLQKRGITWDIIDKYHIGFTTYDNDNKMLSNRIIIPSYNKFGELNYWTGRDYSGFNKQKYFNPKVERKTLIFNEELIQWDADINIVEGPFDHLVVPNSIPLLGKALTPDYKLYWEIVKNANANINIFLDGDAFETVLKTYKLLNHGRLYNKIRFIPVRKEYDPSSLFQLGGSKAIIEHLKGASMINEMYLL